MKNTVKLFGIIALVAVIGFSMVACGDDDDSGGGGGGGTITITGTAKVGETLTATSSGGNFEGDFGWTYSSSKDGPFFPFLGLGEGDNKSKFTLAASRDEGYYIQARRSSGEDLIKSNVVGPVQSE
jgi:hypothetical protein